MHEGEAFLCSALHGTYFVLYYYDREEAPS